MSSPSGSNAEAVCLKNVVLVDNDVWHGSYGKIAFTEKEAMNGLHEPYGTCKITARKPTACEDSPNYLAFYALYDVRKPLWLDGMGVYGFEAIFFCGSSSDKPEHRVQNIVQQHTWKTH